MVEERITDGHRVAELLASEIDGRASGPLAALAISDPDRSVSGTPAGERAFDVRAIEGDRDPRREPQPEARGPLVARVFVHEDGVTLAMHAPAAAVDDAADAAGLERVDVASASQEAVGVAVPTGASVKRAIDALSAVVAPE